MKTTVSEKGQITIPKALRDKLGLTPGTVLEFEAAGGQLVARKRKTFWQSGAAEGSCPAA